MALPASSAAATAALGLGVDPPVYLDEKKRFLDHLNQIRRINLGPDQNDSSGYGLYLVRLPVSISPGECTYQGHGADLTVTVEHEFTSDFLPQSFRNLVINDIVDQLGPVIYEAIRSGFYHDVLEPLHHARIQQKALQAQNAHLLDSLRAGFNQRHLESIRRSNPPGAQPPGAVAALPILTSPDDVITQPLTDYIVRTGKPLSGDPAKDQPIWSAIADRLTATINARANLAGRAFTEQARAGFQSTIEGVRRGEGIDSSLRENVLSYVQTIVDQVVLRDGNSPPSMPIDVSKVDYARFRPWINGLYASALPDDVKILDDLLGLTIQQQNQITQRMAGTNDNVNQLMAPA